MTNTKQGVFAGTTSSTPTPTPNNTPKSPALPSPQIHPVQAVKTQIKHFEVYNNRFRLPAMKGQRPPPFHWGTVRQPVQRSMEGSHVFRTLPPILPWNQELSGLTRKVGKEPHIPFLQLRSFLGISLVIHQTAPGLEKLGQAMYTRHLYQGSTHPKPFATKRSTHPPRAGSWGSAKIPAPMITVTLARVSQGPLSPELT